MGSEMCIRDRCGRRARTAGSRLALPTTNAHRHHRLWPLRARVVLSRTARSRFPHRTAPPCPHRLAHAPCSMPPIVVFRAQGAHSERMMPRTRAKTGPLPFTVSSWSKDVVVDMVPKPRFDTRTRTPRSMSQCRAPRTAVHLVLLLALPQSAWTCTTGISCNGLCFREATSSEYSTSDCNYYHQNCDTPGLAMGDVCEGDGECGTNNDLNNCVGAYEMYIVIGGVPTPEPSWSSEPTVSPRPTNFEAFTATGGCSVSGQCVTSPNYPSYYSNNQACTITPQVSGVLSVVSFYTENYFDLSLIHI